MSASCVFCKICSKTQSSDLLYEDDEIIVFNDIKPAAKYHILAVPKLHINNINSLTNNHRGLIEKLKRVGEATLQQCSADVNDLRVGFHVPPFNSIQHLHLHLISPASDMSFLQKLIFKPNTWWFITVFREWKTNVRRKSRAIQIQINGTGGGPPTKIVLTEQEERLLQLISKIHLGDEAVPESLGGSSVNDCDNLPIMLDTEFEASVTQTLENSHDFVIPDTPGVDNDQYHGPDEDGDLVFESASTSGSKKRKREEETSNTPCSSKRGNTRDSRYSSTSLNSACKNYETAINNLTNVTNNVSDSLKTFTKVYSERSNVLDKQLEAYKERTKILEKELKMKWLEKFSSLDGFDNL